MLRTPAEKDLGIENRFELLFDEPRLGGTGLFVVAEEARKPLRAVAVAISRGLELVGMEHAER